jgi:hypothetical protein
MARSPLISIPHLWVRGRVYATWDANLVGTQAHSLTADLWESHVPRYDAVYSHGSVTLLLLLIAVCMCVCNVRILSCPFF